ncbi:MAG TPA: cupredoxin domain-containing protein [Myxococcales bacterium]|nr:cupredoxin domain-containing protein [Myxococcales bacterium]
MRIAVLTFLLAISCKQQARPEAQSATPGITPVTVTEKGFEPDRIQAAPGEQLTLRFTRKAERTCADAVQVEGDPVKHVLPLDAPVDVKVTAPKTGQIAFACPMNMYRGAIVVVAH